jgi:hypothetical protein
MRVPRHPSAKNAEARWILWGIPVLFIAGSLLHSAYEWSGRFKVAAIFSPINESVWEHLKLAFWPLVAWWSTGLIILSKKHSIFATQWLVSSAAAQLACQLVIVAFYYTYTGALGIKSLVLDIFSFLLGLTAGQGLALHHYRYASFNRYWLGGAFVLLFLMATAFTVFTFTPPHLPLFQDAQTGKYGI